MEIGHRNISDEVKLNLCESDIQILIIKKLVRVIQKYYIVIDGAGQYSHHFYLSLEVNCICNKIIYQNAIFK